MLKQIEIKPATTKTLMVTNITVTEKYLRLRLQFVLNILDIVGSNMVKEISIELRNGREPDFLSKLWRSSTCCWTVYNSRVKNWLIKDSRAIEGFK